MIANRDRYYYALAGAVGGLVSWFVAGLVLDLLCAQSVLPNRLQVLITGLVVGAGIGFAISSRERTMLVDWRFGLRDGLFGAIAGAIGGAVSSLGAHWMFVTFGQNLTGRIAAYVILGSFIGTSEGLKWWRQGGGLRALYGAVGGLFGGAAAGIVFHVLSMRVSSTIGDALSYTALGLLLGLCTSAACVVGKMAVLAVMAAPKDKLLGQQLPLGAHGSRDVLGSNPNVSIPIFTDERMAREHAEITSQGREFFVLSLPGDRNRPGHVMINGEPLVGQRQLSSGDTINAGDTTLQFRLLSDAFTVKTRDGKTSPETEESRKKALWRT